MFSEVPFQMSQFTPNFIANELITSNAENLMLVRDPAQGEVMTRVPLSTHAEIEMATSSAAKAFVKWSKTPKNERRDMIFLLSNLIRYHENLIVTTISRETGKTIPDSRSEVKRGIEMVQGAAVMTDRMGERAEMRSAVQVFTDRHPLGVCLMVTPFNLPFLVPLWSVPFAIALGNCAILKPSPLCPMSAMWIALLMREAGIPSGVLSVIHGNKSTVHQLIAHKLVRAVSFVGTEAAGNQVYDLCCRHRKRIQANMGGKNHTVILPDSPKEFTVTALIQSCFGSTGQRCTSPKVAVLVGDARTWVADFISAAKALRIGPPEDDGVDIGPMITPEAKIKLLTQIRVARDEGAEVVLDGTQFHHQDYPQGNWLGPTILANVTTDMACYNEETFGPLLVCINVDSLEEAIDMINTNRFGNGCSIFTSNGALSRQFQRDVNIGIVNINNPHTAPQSSFSFTSNKDSFLGECSFYGPDCVNFFTFCKTVTSLWHHPDQIARAHTLSASPSTNPPT